MRLLTLVVVALLFVGMALAYFAFFEASSVAVPELVPGNFRFGLFHSSVNDLEELYEGRHRRIDLNPSEVRIGRRINVPGLDGIDYDRPVASFVDRDKIEWFLVPVKDRGAFEDAFDTNREALNLRPPQRVGPGYLSLSAASGQAKAGAPTELVAEAVRYPLALAGHPEQPVDVRLMLRYLLAWDNDPKLLGAPQLSEEIAKIPDRAAGFVAEECADLVIGLRRSPEETIVAEVDVVATPEPGGLLERAAEVAATVDFPGLLGGFPRDTRVLVGGVLDKQGWERTGLALPVGDAAFAFGIVVKPYHARRYNLLCIARPRHPDALARLERDGEQALLEGPTELDFKTIQDGDAKIRTAELKAPPQWLEGLLRTSARTAPPVYVTTATEKGAWIVAIGSQAEGTVRNAVLCLRGARELSVLGSHREAHAGPIQKSSPLRDVSQAVAVAMATAEGMQAFQYPMPQIDIAGIGRPASFAFTLTLTDKVRGTLRLASR
ncbi:MAG: hypothetical protein ACYTGN_10380 [Planctomycetota bacterium]|jgi:hypothetical protein